ncbi:hypothetical protein BJV82DRAFT_84507 [Fennellomyces sp. T-0311]|nr:hypothetical protein BJV82DRAFT_84507 [Fennellomyces sp. T-0311]
MEYKYGHRSFALIRYLTSNMTYLKKKERQLQQQQQEQQQQQQQQQNNPAERSPPHPDRMRGGAIRPARRSPTRESLSTNPYSEGSSRGIITRNQPASPRQNTPATYTIEIISSAPSITPIDYTAPSFRPNTRTLPYEGEPYAGARTYPPSNSYSYDEGAGDPFGIDSHTTSTPHIFQGLVAAHHHTGSANNDVSSQNQNPPAPHNAVFGPQHIRYNHNYYSTRYPTGPQYGIYQEPVSSVRGAPINPRVEIPHGQRPTSASPPTTDDSDDTLPAVITHIPQPSVQQRTPPRTTNRDDTPPPPALHRINTPPLQLRPPPTLPGFRSILENIHNDQRRGLQPPNVSQMFQQPFRTQVQQVEEVDLNHPCRRVVFQEFVTDANRWESVTHVEWLKGALQHAPDGNCIYHIVPTAIYRHYATSVFEFHDFAADASRVALQMNNLGKYGRKY